MTERSLHRRLLCSASAIYAGSRALAGSMASRYVYLQRQGSLRIHGVFRSFSYDETPLGVRLRAEKGGPITQVASTSKLLQSYPIQLLLLILNFKYVFFYYMHAIDNATQLALQGMSNSWCLPKMWRLASTRV